MGKSPYLVWRAKAGHVAGVLMGKMNILRRYQMTSYVLGTLGWTWSFWGILILSGMSPRFWLWKELFVLGLSGPLAASMGMAYLIGGKAEIRRLLERAFPLRISLFWYLLALGLLPLLMLGAAGLCRESLNKHPELFDSSLVALAPMFLWLLFRSGPVNEEFGWRGFLLPRLLQRASPFSSSLILGAIWTGWHWPLWFLSGVPHPHWPFGLFFLMVMALNFVFTWFYLKTKGSVLIAILFHGSINAGIKFITILPPDFSSLAPFIFLVGLAWIMAGVIILFDHRLWFGRLGAAHPPKILADSIENRPSLKPSLPMGLK